LVGHGGVTSFKLQATGIGAVMPCHIEFQRLQGVGLCLRLQTPGVGVACPGC